MGRRHRQRQHPPLQRAPRHVRRLHPDERANRIAQPRRHAYSDPAWRRATTSTVVTAEDLAGNVGPASNEAIAARWRGTRPLRPWRSRARRPGAVISGAVTVAARPRRTTSRSTGVQFKLDGAESRRGGHERALLGRAGTRALASNGAHTSTAVARDARRERDDVGRGRRHRLEHRRRARDGALRSTKPRAQRPPTPRARATAARSPGRPARPRARTAARSRSTA